MRIKLIASLSLALGIAAAPMAVSAGANENAVANVIASYRPGASGFKNIIVKKVTINSSTKTIIVSCSEEGTYLPLTSERLKQLKSDILAKLGAQYKNYKVKITAGGKNLDDLVLYKTRTHGPKERGRFVTDLSAQEAPKGLDGSNIALWQSHGWYFEPKLNRWEWQRARVMQTVEDLYTQSYVMPFLMPMLENAGAYVMSPRERDINLTEIIIDGDNKATAGYSEKNGSEKWKSSQKAGFAWDGNPLINGQHPFSDGTARIAKTVSDPGKESQAIWSAEIPVDGNYAVYVSYNSFDNSAPDAVYTISTATGERQFKVNQAMGGGTWIYLGHFPLEASDGKQPIVKLSNVSQKTGSVVSADAVKIGGGYGVVSRIVKEGDPDIEYQYITSGYPKFTEGARYFLQWAGAPDSVFTPSDYENDYTDDYRSRALWVNWLAGGSSQLPDSAGLKIPIDLSLAFHSDAGTFNTDSVVGTLGIYCTVGDVLGNGDSRLGSRDLTDLVMTSIVNDVRDQFEPNWTRRGMWDKSYFEARAPLVPAMLLELLSHQNFYDMQFGLDPSFRFTVSRAIYKGMLKFIAHRDGRDYTVQPLPVKDFAIVPLGRRAYRLTWHPTHDSQEPTAEPTYYIIEQRTNYGTFEFLTKTDKPEFTLNISDDNIHSFRIIAGNDGGISFPSEVLAVADLNNGSEAVCVVNGFTRVSAPDRFDYGEEYAGFADDKDHGVPYIQDISYIGSQYEFRRNIPWMDDDAAGFGSSRSNYETEVIAGNTFDYPFIHGDAITAAGHSFYSVSVGAYINTDAGKDAKIIDLILGKQKEIKIGRGAYGTRYKAFPTELQEKIANATKNGTSFFISGSFVATDIWDNPNSSEEVADADKAFAEKVLGYIWRTGQASSTGEVYEVPSRFKQFNDSFFYYLSYLNPDCYVVESPDSFYPADESKSATIMRYKDNNLIAGTASDFGNYRTVILGFPFETVEEYASRAELMNQILSFFTEKK